VTFRVFESIDELSPAVWNGLGGHHVVTTHGWLAAIEKSSIQRRVRLYFLAEDGDGVAGGILAQVQDDSGWLGLDSVLFGPAARAIRLLGAGALPALVCGSDAGAGEPVLLRAGAGKEEQRGIAAALIDYVTRYAAGRGWRVGFRNVPAGAHVVAEVLGARGFLRTREWPTTSLEIPGPAFEDYLHALRLTHPATARNIRGERNRGRRGGLGIERLDSPGSQAVELHGVMERHYQRINGCSFPYGPTFFGEIESRLPEEVDIYVARLGEELAGVTFMLKYGDTVHMPMIGFDAEKGRPSALYFNLGYNEPIAICAAAGVRRIVFGRTRYGTKVRRGCAIRELDLYLHPGGPLRRAAWQVLFPPRSKVLQRRIAESVKHDRW
jgi:predicted N-acyltransferase